MKHPNPLLLPIVYLGVYLGVLLGACGDGGDSGEDLSGPRSNVLLVTLDTTRADYLGTYGWAGNPTPHFDSIARAGTRFDLAVASASVTPVAHASILTGRENQNHGLRVLTGEGGYRLPKDVPTIATLLEEEGYETAAIHSAFPVSSYFGFERGFKLFDDLDTELASKEEGERPSWDVATFQRRSDETTDRAVAYLREVTGPFLLWVHYWDPHDGKLRPPGSKAKNYRKLYPEEIAYMDGEFGRLLGALETEGLARDTMILVVADHGQGLGDHGWSGHRLLFQEDIRVPLLIRMPGAQQVKSVGDLVRTTDILPTVLEHLRIPAPDGIDGRSLRGLLLGEEEVGRVAFADQINRFDHNANIVEERPLDDFLYCAMDREWKLVYRPTNPDASELYHLSADPGELVNLFAERPEEVLRLMKELAHQAPFVLQPFSSTGDEDREDALDALTALGYVEGTEDAQVITEWEWLWSCPDPEHTLSTDEPRGCEVCGTPCVPRAK